MKTVIAVVIALAVVGGGWYWYTTSGPGAQTPSADTTTNDTTNDTANSPDQAAQGDVNVTINVNDPPTSASVALTASGFSPKSVTIKKGGTVTFVNQGTAEMWVASAPHPTHTGYDGTTEQQHCASGYTGAKPFDQCSGGNSFSFTFNKVGSFNYHNHENTSSFGTIVVVE